jgi:hypothetical protein
LPGALSLPVCKINALVPVYIETGRVTNAGSVGFVIGGVASTAVRNWKVCTEKCYPYWKYGSSYVTFNCPDLIKESHLLLFWTSTLWNHLEV